MSRIGKMPITLPKGVEASISGQNISIKGPKGTLSFELAKQLQAKQENGSLVVSRADEERLTKSVHGMSRTMLANMIVGVTNGYSKKINITGVGYKVAPKGKDLEFALGYSHPVIFKADPGITFKIDSPTEIEIIGIDKQLVGETAAKIQKLRKSDPYKGKGLHLVGARIRRKQGKTGKK